jgi:hypothetical protein
MAVFERSRIIFSFTAAQCCGLFFDQAPDVTANIVQSNKTISSWVEEFWTS